MPSPSFSIASAGKPRSSMIRQLSLQTTKELIKTVEGRSLRRQHSEECKLLTDEVRVTGKRWALEKEYYHQPKAATGSTIRQDSGGRGLISSAKMGSKPRPARVAWGERRSESTESMPGEGVEIVARRCEGQPRPTVRMPRASSGLPLASATPGLLSRQQLAERLRRAWRTRDQQHNLDIFLAQPRRDELETPKSGRNPVRATHQPLDQNLNVYLTTDGSEDDDKSTYRPNSNKSSSRAPQKSPKPPDPQVVQEQNKIEINISGNIDQSDHDDIDAKPPAFADLLDFKMFPVAEVTKKFGSDFSSRQFQIASMSVAKNLSFDSTENKENLQDDDRQHINLMSASARRASFRTSHLFSKAIAESGSDDEDSVSAPLRRPSLLRASSAPTPRLLSPADGNTNAHLKSPHGAKSPHRVLSGSTKSAILSDSSVKKSTKCDRKLKPSGSRRKEKDRKQSTAKDSSDEESIENKAVKPTKRRQIPHSAGDVITMVSLVSPTESDNEDPSSIPAWVEVPESSSPAKRGEPSKSEVSKIVSSAPLIFSLAPKKTVSFQSHPPVSRSYSSSFPLRRAPPGAPIIVPSPQQNSLLTVPRQDNRGIKRRLIRSYTAPTKDEDEENHSSDDSSKTETSPEPIPRCSNENDEETVDEDDEPELKTAKERECWQLYKRMLEKGVSVSYDTVLRGMMTPTEYRLRKTRS